MNELVTVIIPVYNVEQYLDRCVKSIIKQTYSNLEILLINDGSTDNSLKKCLEWQGKDNRIRVIDKENEGLGPTRNVGIEKATGEWIISVDSDDWVTSQYVETLLSAVVQNNADMAVSNFYMFHEATQKVTLWRGIEQAILIQTPEEKIRYMKANPLPSFMAKIYKKSMLVNKQIKQPSTTAQDLAVLVQTIACAKKIVLIPEAHWYYWIDRSSSLTNSINKANHFPDVFKYSVNEMKRLGLFEQYKEGQLVILYKHSLAMLKKFATKETYDDFRREYMALFDETFPEWQRKVGMSWLVYGSFNARWVAHECSHSNICTPRHYTFSSLISQFLGKQGYHYEVEHDNPFRMASVEADIKGICSKIQITDEAGILIDFLDERNDIVETKDGVYFSRSEAFKECKIKGMEVKRVIQYGSSEYMHLWEEACLKFIEYLRSRTAKIPVFLLKMRMAKGYGMGKLENWYDNQEEINNINKKIEEMEQFFIRNCAEVVYVQGVEELYYTRDGHIHGVFPWHLNQLLYRDMREKMEQLGLINKI